MPLPAILSRQSGLEDELLCIKELPSCSRLDIMKFISKKELYLDTDLRILRSRLAHYYG